MLALIQDTLQIAERIRHTADSVSFMAVSISQVAPRREVTADEIHAALEAISDSLKMQADTLIERLTSYQQQPDGDA